MWKTELVANNTGNAAGLAAFVEREIVTFQVREPSSKDETIVSLGSREEGGWHGWSKGNFSHRVK